MGNMGLLKSSSDRLLTGVVIIVFATVMLFSALGFFDRNILGNQLDVIAAFFLLIIGAALVFSEADKGGKD